MMNNLDQQIKLRQQLAEDIILEFCESSHGAYAELQEAWDECEEKFGAMIPENPAYKLFEATIRFTLEAKQLIEE